MLNSVNAEFLLIRKRVNTWILLGLWVFLGANFGYILPYLSYLSGSDDSRVRPLAALLPAEIIGTLLSGYPFFGGVMVLILGAIAFGSEYGWGTLKTVYTQRPGRLHVFAAKLIALGVTLTTFVLIPFVVGALISYVIAVREDAPIVWPDAWLIVRGLAAGWFLMTIWAGFGAALAVLSRGTALAIGVGILYGLVIEGLLAALVNDVSLLQPLGDGLLRTNGYSLIEPLGLVTELARASGPGSFFGPYVGDLQAFLTLAAYLSAFILLSGLLLRRRDVV
ncbi:MAG: ABC transporter permease [Chloroflexi bacterium]|nr:ABC transporter permease [Chloroflexota bacterium]